LDLIRHAISLGARVSLGHSNALAAETLAAIDAGAISATHTFNAMRALDHREPGILGIALDDDRLFAEIICDGIHVAPPLVRLWLKAKGLDRAILVTDAMSATGMPDGEYRLAGLSVQVANGRALLSSDLAQGKQTLAGSVLTLDYGVANLQRFTGASLAHAARMASHNPAAMLGRPELTRIHAGDAANLNRFDAASRLTATYIRGQQIR
jgi:N-acetylglucosamine-6-phosphate deacetylase